MPSGQVITGMVSVKKKKGPQTQSGFDYAANSLPTSADTGRLYAHLADRAEHRRVHNSHCLLPVHTHQVLLTIRQANTKPIFIYNYTLSYTQHTSLIVSKIKPYRNVMLYITKTKGKVPPTYTQELFYSPSVAFCFTNLISLNLQSLWHDGKYSRCLNRVYYRTIYICQAHAIQKLPVLYSYKVLLSSLILFMLMRLEDGNTSPLIRK